MRAFTIFVHMAIEAIIAGSAFALAYKIVRFMLDACWETKD
jgi:hypothetical protein